jgi:hypothetical protein
MDHCHLYQQLKCCHSRNIGGSALRDMVSVDNDLRRRFGFEDPQMWILPSLLHMHGVHCHGVHGGSGVASSRQGHLLLGTDRTLVSPRPSLLSSS